MIRIAITAAAFEAIAATLPLGRVGYENATNERDERLSWLEPRMVDQLGALRSPGESYSDVILRLATESYGQKKPHAAAARRVLRRGAVRRA